MFEIRIRYEQKGKTEGVFIVNPDHIREVQGESLVEALSKFVLEVTSLQESIHKDELSKLRMQQYDDDIPF